MKALAFVLALSFVATALVLVAPSAAASCGGVADANCDARTCYDQYGNYWYATDGACSTTAASGHCLVWLDPWKPIGHAPGFNLGPLCL